MYGSAMSIRSKAASPVFGGSFGQNRSIGFGGKSSASRSSSVSSPPPPPVPGQSLFSTLLPARNSPFSSVLGSSATFGLPAQVQAHAPPAPFLASSSLSLGAPTVESEDEDEWEESAPTAFTPQPSGSIPANPFSMFAMRVSPTIANPNVSSTQSTPGSLLASIARLQQWHGGFRLDRNLLRLLGHALNTKLSQSYDVDDFARKLQNEVGIDEGDVGATILALIWMERFSKATDTTDGDDETLDMREKGEEWVKARFGGGVLAEKRLGESKEGILTMMGIN
ncbi:hypothetical protein J3R30DRAFT_3404034 [Lentinula aciculospora]|uniref:Uncharacterized protein n=1 Tax=Lentinula aciculospora TaxID=153920 RepID=A0A9W9AD23_9AGAR|nr:hypothetical protein J3R30DRAFT_3404034 [Lentinula aciculospora]